MLLFILRPSATLAGAGGLALAWSVAMIGLEAARPRVRQAKGLAAMVYYALAVALLLVAAVIWLFTPTL